MNICEESHEPKFQVIYKSARGRTYTPEWLVCESCMENRTCFGDEEQIESVTILA